MIRAFSDSFGRCPLVSYSDDVLKKIKGIRKESQIKKQTTPSKAELSQQKKEMNTKPKGLKVSESKLS